MIKQAYMMVCRECGEQFESAGLRKYCDQHRAIGRGNRKSEIALRIIAIREDDPSRTYQSIADELGITKQRVQQYVYRNREAILREENRRLYQENRELKKALAYED